MIPSLNARILESSEKMTLDEVIALCAEYRSPDADFLDKKPKEILSTVELWVSDVAAQSRRINWLLIAEVATTQTLRDVENEMVWAKIAILAYEYLATVEPDYFDRNLFEAMRVRANLVIKYGSQSNDFILDAKKIIQWGTNRTLTLEQAQAIFENGSSPQEQISYLLSDLDKVRTLIRLVNASLLLPDNDLKDWIAFEDTVARRWFARGKFSDQSP